VPRAEAWFGGLGIRFERMDRPLNPRRGYRVVTNLEQGSKHVTYPEESGESGQVRSVVLRQQRMSLESRVYLPLFRRQVLAVGGDGTVQEVVNGMFAGAEPLNPDAVLAVASSGSGCDFIRTFGLNRPPAVLARHFATEDVLPVDAGRATFVDRDGRAAERLFVNIAEVGFGAEAVRLAERLPRALGRFRYLFAAWGAIRRMTRPEATVVLGHTTQVRPLVNLVVANAQFFGGGMKVAPRALPDDGKFNVQLYFGPRSQVFVLTQKIYRGEHLPNPQISEYQSPIVEVTSSEALPVEADGELLGSTPATFSLLEKTLRLKI
jgi:diacylglycerol kinase (ATP)